MEKKEGEEPKARPYQRFKTEAEFMQEFGDGWRSLCSWSYTNAMDYLFGQEYNGNIEAIPNPRESVNSWIINNRMLTSNPLPLEVYDILQGPGIELVYCGFGQRAFKDWEFVELPKGDDNGVKFDPRDLPEGYISRGNNRYWKYDPGCYKFLKKGEKPKESEIEDAHPEEAVSEKVKPGFIHTDAKFRPGMQAYYVNIDQKCRILGFTESPSMCSGNVFVEVACKCKSKYEFKAGLMYDNYGKHVKLPNTIGYIYIVCQHDLLPLEEKVDTDLGPLYPGASGKSVEIPIGDLLGKPSAPIEESADSNAKAAAFAEDMFQTHLMGIDPYKIKYKGSKSDRVIAAEMASVFLYPLRPEECIKSDDEINILPVPKVPELIDLDF